MNLHSVPVLTTEHYRLRSLKKEDAPALFEFMKDRMTMKFITPHPVRTLKEMEEEVERRVDGFRRQKEIPWVIENEHGDVIGFFRLHKIHLWHRKAELGAVIRPGDQKRGVMTEVLKIILDYSFENLQLNRIVGDIFAENTGSRRLLDKFGFREEGVLRQTDFDGEEFHDTVVFSMLKKEYDELKQTFD